MNAILVIQHPLTESGWGWYKTNPQNMITQGILIIKLNNKNKRLNWRGVVTALWGKIMIFDRTSRAVPVVYCYWWDMHQSGSLSPARSELSSVGEVASHKRTGWLCRGLDQTAKWNGPYQPTAIFPTVPRHCQSTVLARNRPLGYERVYLPLYKVADTPFYSKGTNYLSGATTEIKTIGFSWKC